MENTKKTRSEFKRLYDKITEGVKICDKCSWYQYSEKSTKFFHRLEKQNAICGTIKTLINNGKKITMPHNMNLFLKSFYKNYIKNIKKICF